MPKLVKSSTRVTVYATANRIAALAAVPGIDAIQVPASSVSSFAVEHVDARNPGTVLADVAELLRGKLPKERPGLEPATNAFGKYWRLVIR
jgi:hypothetical protein